MLWDGAPDDALIEIQFSIEPLRVVALPRRLVRSSYVAAARRSVCLTDGVHSVTTGRQLAALRSTIGPGQDELVAALPE